MTESPKEKETQKQDRSQEKTPGKKKGKPPSSSQPEKEERKADFKAITQPIPVRARPLSPHLQVWRWHATMLSSILHRITGVGLYIGAMGLVVWLLALAVGGSFYKFMEQIIVSIPGQILLLGFIYAILYHLLNGVRHLIWDSGAGFAPRQANQLSIFILIISAILTLVLWLISLSLKGAL